VAKERDEKGDKEARNIWGGALALFILGILVTLPLTGAPPPEQVRIATGPAGGMYARAGERLALALERAGITGELVETEGSAANLAQLEAGQVDLAFVQGGIVEGEPSEEIQGLASLYYEPLWIFQRSAVGANDLGGLTGRTLEVGEVGSGTRAVVLKLLAANGLDAVAAVEDGTWRDSAPEQAVANLLAGEVDVMFLITAPDSPHVRHLFDATSAGAVCALPLERAYAYSRHFPFLRDLTLTPGMISLRERLPDTPIPLVAPSANVLARAELHAAVVPLVLEALTDQFGRSALFEDAQEFPNPRQLDVAPGVAAETYYKTGRSFLYRVLPFQIAAALDRLKILLLPLVTLLIPLIKLAPPIYRWRIRSRIFRWYQTIMRLEATLRQSSDAKEHEQARSELAALDEELRGVQVPLSYAEELYNLRMHLRLVEGDLADDAQGATPPSDS